MLESGVDLAGVRVVMKIGDTTLNLAKHSNVQASLVDGYIAITREQQHAERVMIMLRNIGISSPSVAFESDCILVEYRSSGKALAGLILSPNRGRYLYIPDQPCTKPRPGNEFEIIVYRVRVHSVQGKGPLPKWFNENLGQTRTKSGQFSHFVHRKNTFSWEYVGGAPVVFRFRFVSDLGSTALTFPPLPAHPKFAEQFSSTLLGPFVQAEHNLCSHVAHVRDGLKDESISGMLLDVGQCMVESIRILQAYACTPWPRTAVLREYIKEKGIYMSDLLCELLEVMRLHPATVSKWDMCAIRGILTSLEKQMAYLDEIVTRAQSETLLDSTSAEGNVFL
ncbi:hypothetical protein K474DRAFT_1384324 [Panus rudis PR-1116 ss-1]|nr:hypothetical protein K474DRAFT_1384324 [Panus rudis PR-1116 ss-1]